MDCRIYNSPDTKCIQYHISPYSQVMVLTLQQSVKGRNNLGEDRRKTYTEI